MVRIRRRDGRHQRLGIYMKRIPIQFCLVRHLHHMAQVHDRDPVADVADHAEIMGDKQIRQAMLFLKLLHQIQHLGAHGHIQGGHRFIADDQLRIQSHGPGDPDSLPLSPGKLMGKPLHVMASQPHFLQKLLHPLPALLFTPYVVDGIGLSHNLLHRHLRIQGCVRVLKHHLHLPARLTEPGALHMRNRLAAEQDLALCRFQKPQDHPACGGFAAAALPHQPQSFPLIQLQVHSVHSLNPPCVPL